MSKFLEKKKEIFEASAPKKEGDKRKHTFNRQQFDELGTALLNDPDFEDVVLTTKNGELTEVVSKPVADLRKAMIGDPLKAAGVDADDAAKIVKEHQYSGTLPLYPVVSVLMEGYLDAGKSFNFERRKDMNATLTMVARDEETKESRTPGKGDVKTTSVYGAHRVIKSSSKCPNHLKKKIK